jgi:hypothetical protein
VFEGFAERVQRRGADVAVHDAEGAERECAHSRLVAPVMIVAGSVGVGGLGGGGRGVGGVVAIERRLLIGSHAPMLLRGRFVLSVGT